MSLVKTELLNDLYSFIINNYYQLTDEYMRESKQYRDKMPFSAWAVLFYAKLNELTDNDRQQYDSGSDSDLV